MATEGFPRQSFRLAEIAESELVECAQRGKGWALAALFHTHKRRVYWLCQSMTGTPEEAEDLTQKAFLRAFRKISTFRGESTFFAWLYPLVVKIILIHLRKKRSPKTSRDQADPFPAPPSRDSFLRL